MEGMLHGVLQNIEWVRTLSRPPRLRRNESHCKKFWCASISISCFNFSQTQVCVSCLGFSLQLNDIFGHGSWRFGSTKFFEIFSCTMTSQTPLGLRKKNGRQGKFFKQLVCLNVTILKESCPTLRRLHDPRSGQSKEAGHDGNPGSA